jgi:Raf kinase inhibitor-like YbhB/YbcL family protein
MNRLALFVLLLASCNSSDGVGAPKTIQLSSPDFSGEIPEKFARKAPHLAWSNFPAGTRELALVVDDPDAPTAEPYVHYVLTKITPAEGGPPPIVGKCESGKAEWEPLDPPKGETHRYRFRVYALDISLPATSMTSGELGGAIKGHVLAWGELRATYRSPGP